MLAHRSGAVVACGSICFWVVGGLWLFLALCLFEPAPHSSRSTLVFPLLLMSVLTIGCAIADIGILNVLRRKGSPSFVSPVVTVVGALVNQVVLLILFVPPPAYLLALAIGLPPLVFSILGMVFLKNGKMQ